MCFHVEPKLSTLTISIAGIIFSLCLGAFVANFSGLSGLGVSTKFIIFFMCDLLI